MKTPREVLLARHQAAGPKLDAVRRKVVLGMNHEGTREQSWLAALVPSFFGCLKMFWRELIFPCRQIWTGLAAIWLLLFLVNFSQRDAGSSGQPARSPAVMMSWQVQQRWMNELFADRAPAADADRPKISPTKPRSEILKTTAV